MLGAAMAVFSSKKTRGARTGKIGSFIVNAPRSEVWPCSQPTGEILPESMMRGSSPPCKVASIDDGLFLNRGIIRPRAPEMAPKKNRLSACSACSTVCTETKFPAQVSGSRFVRRSLKVTEEVFGWNQNQDGVWLSDSRFPLTWSLYCHHCTAARSPPYQFHPQTTRAFARSEE